MSIQRTEASERCGLAGNYWLKAESDILILKEPIAKRKVLVWPYKLLRRYGRDRVSTDKTSKYIKHSIFKRYSVPAVHRVKVY